MRNTYKALLAIIIQYILFFYPILSPNNVLIGSFTTDALSLHYPSRAFLYENLHENKQFFWTERIYGGFPVYTDLERGFLNPVNILSLIFFDPVNSYKILHFIYYFTGAYFLYKFLKEKGLGLTSFIVANLIFYFSFYSMVRQELFNTVLTIYLLPVGLYLTEKLISTQKYRYAIFKGIWIWSMVSWGQFNFITICLLIDAVYFLTNSYRKLSIRKFLTDCGLIVLTSIILCLPLVYPFLKVFLSGNRGGGDLNYLEGSYSPIVALTSLFPFIWGEPSNFIGEIIKHGYYFNEVYNYIGIAATLLAVYGLLLLNNKREKIFFGVLIFVYVCLAFIKYVPLLNSFDIPLISSFRYWGRASLLLTFTCAYLAAVAVNNIRLNKINFKNILFFLPAILTYILILLSNLKNLETTSTVSYILNGGIPRNDIFYIYLIVFFLTLFFIIFSIISKKTFRFFSYYFVLLVCVDLFIPSLKLTKIYYENRQIFDKNISLGLEKYINQRIIHLNDKQIFGNTMMYQKSWGLFGYSAPLESKEYIEYITNLGFSSVRRPKIDSPPEKWDENFLSNVERTGVSTIIKKDGSLFQITPNRTFDLFLNSGSILSGEYITKEEGNLLINIRTDTEQKIQTTIRNYPGWQLKINGNKQNLDNKPDDLFISFTVPKGSSTIELRYKPTDFYKGVFYSIGVATFSLFGYLLLNKKAKFKSL